ncbi:MAG TPA: hypothetical protein VFI02_21550 [Armatimonadota bacterium]|nr:hypothetical protein [Armatimonadota bacterium]
MATLHDRQEAVASQNVPMWNHFGHDIRDATPEQLSFYRWWLKELEQGRVPDIGGNCAYVEMLIHSKVEEFERTGDVGTFREQLQALAKAFGGCSEADEGVGTWLSRRLQALAKARGGCPSRQRHRIYLLNLVRQAFLVIGDYDGAWEAGRSLPLQPEDLAYLRPKCTCKSIDGLDIVRIPLAEVQGLTRFGEEHIAEIVEVATHSLSVFEEEHGCNYIEHVCQSAKCESGRRLPDCPNLIYGLRENPERFHSMRQGESYPEMHPNTTPPRAIAGPYVSYVVEEAVGAFLRECENALREKLGLPRIGEGWLAETELFRRVCEAFPNEEIVQHGRPAWLPGQHLDVYFSKRNIACEYQGVQHNEPVDHFGGIEGYIEGKKRDSKKKRLCEKHGCQLIYVYEGYDLSEVVRHVEDAFG